MGLADGLAETRSQKPMLGRRLSSRCNNKDVVYKFGNP